jgi:putative ABC transport system permease protein
MRLLRSLRSILAVALGRRRFESAMSSELQFHIDAYTADLIRGGMPRAEAERRARAEFGGTEGLKDALRAARGQRLFDELRQDTRYAIRGLRRSRGHAIVAVLALGIGVNLAVFSVIHTSLLRPLPHPQPDRLVSIASRNLESGRTHQTAPLDFFDFEARSSSLARIAAYYPPGFTITGGSEAERVSGARASSGIFEVLGVQPVIGRGFLPVEDRDTAAFVTVISYEVWQRRFRGEAAAVGQSLTLSGRPYTVVGVLPAGFGSPAMWPRTPDVWVPLGVDPNVGRRNTRMLRILGRLGPGATVAQANAELDGIARALATEYPDTNAGTGAAVAGLHEQLTREVRPSLYALAAAVLALLLVACANAAGLLVGGSLERRAEFATRLALGASRARIVRQIVAENLVLGGLAGVIGFGLALWTTDYLVGTATAAGLPRAAEIRVGWITFAVGALLSIGCTLACSLVAAFEAVRARDLRVVRGSASTPRRNRARAGLIAVEAALSLALLAGAALLVRSFYELQTTTPGFDPANLVTTRLSVPQARYPAGPVLASFYDRAVERVAAVPGVESASVIDWLPSSGFGVSVGFTVSRGTTPAVSALAELRVVGLDYFHTVRMPIVAGRAFDRRDADGAPRVVAINESLARAYFGEADPIGQRLTFERDTRFDAEIVAVVGDVRELALRIPAGPGVYAPKTQQPWLRHETRDLVVRVAAGAPSPATAIHAALRELEPDIPRSPVLPMDAVIANALKRPGFYASAVAAFALIAVLLAGFGIYGTVASAIAERRRELGVRLALGASPGDVLVRAARYGAAPTLAGLVAGVPLALASGRIVREQLYGIEPADWPTLLTVVVCMSAIGITAALLPSIRAARIDPAVTLRHEVAE